MLTFSKAHSCTNLILMRRDTLNNLILKSPSDWQTTVALPFVKIEGTTVEWDVRASDQTSRACIRMHTRRHFHSDSQFFPILVFILSGDSL